MFRNNTIRKAAGVSGLFAAVMLTAPSAMAAPIHRANDEVRLPIRAQAQERDQWCWSATGTTIANYKGVSVSQNQFCNLAWNRNKDDQCPNTQATLENDQQAFQSLGINPGRLSGPISYQEVQKEINADRPVLTRVLYRAGGGHMVAISGFRASDQSIEWYDPWPSKQRLNVGDYNFYVNNQDFSWTHTLSQIGG
ncbi:Uncharacterised protein [Dermatophilus congolensis]|uniref:Papain-like cysteine protease AvrRpt2 n=1 Tax=Dermatophilus congolensis TaxID=1863 RepID=A0AA46H130_9MICO|nr:papain-like cysteine protease family protein [Dermatophilus congolensis]STD12705.1 Uncharacterised protein [Dermatophilus congolensis]